MGLSQKLLALFLSASLYGVDKEHVSYLMQSNELKTSLSLYEEYKKELGRHDFEVLERMGTIILEQGIRSADPETQLLSIFGAAIAGLSSSIDILEEGIKSPNFDTQLAAIQSLARMQDDRCDELLTKAMSSPFILARMEAGFHLSQRKHRKAAGQIEALMYRIPHEFRFYFPQFFALIGTSDAIAVLRQLMEDPFPMVRVEAILSAARHGRDDLLPKIRAHATHLHPDEQEACATALGILKDSKSLAALSLLANSPSPYVKLGALRSLYILGDTTSLQKMIDLALKHNLFAISLLGDFPGSEETLFDLLYEKNLSVRFNAAISLLKRRSSKCLPVIEEILIKDTRDLGFQPLTSVGHSLSTWKVIPSLHQHLKESFYDLHAISLNLREQLLIEAIELPEPDFLKLAHKIFDSQVLDLIPLLVSLLENHQTEKTLELLEQKAHAAGAPLARAYCNLALYRLGRKGDYEEVIRQWIELSQNTEMIRFRPILPWNMRTAETPFELTPEDSSRLLIEAYQALSNRHDEKGIEMLLNALEKGHPRNRYAVAGLLIRAIQ
jgi:HEAT repeat protein